MLRAENEQESRTSTAQSKYWVFTINNYRPIETAGLQDLPVGAHERVTYLIVGKEVGAQGTPHLQGYIEFKKKMRRGGVSALCCLQRARLAIANGSAEENRTYCTKEGPPFIEKGVPRNLGRPRGRSDLAAAAHIASSTRNLKRVAEDYPETFIKYHKGFGALLDTLADNGGRRVDMSVTVLIGPTGCGKTRWVHDNEPDVYIQTGERWFDGYRGQEAVLFDDFDGSLPIAWVLRLLDIYPMQVPVKTSFTWWKPKRVYITSNKSPTEWYPNADRNHMAALLRRLTVVANLFAGDALPDARVESSVQADPASGMGGVGSQENLGGDRAEGERPRSPEPGVPFFMGRAFRGYE